MTKDIPTDEEIRQKVLEFNITHLDTCYPAYCTHSINYAISLTREADKKALASQKQKFLEEVNNFVKEYREKNPNPIPHTYDEGRRDGILLFQKRLKSLVSGSEGER